MTGKELAAIRKAAGLSQTDLAQLAGIGRHAVSYWETKPTVDAYAWAVQRMAEALGLGDIRAEIRARALTDTPAPTVDAHSAAEAYLAKLFPPVKVTRRTTHLRGPCGAMTRKGTPCRAKAIPGKGRCKFHGGMSTGARTPEGRERIAEAQRRRWARWRAAKADPGE
ncbi:MAG: helix-turn-helix transcriptional regulator [Thalassovita sp.]